MKQMDGSPVDLALITLPACVANRPRVINKFINSSDIDLLKEGSLVFSGFYELNGKTIVTERYPSSFDVSIKSTSYSRHETGKCPDSIGKCVCPTITIGNHLTYNGNSRRNMWSLAIYN
jgi:hypothetical protein